MRRSGLIFLSIPALWLSVGLAQESTQEAFDELLCEQCPFDAPVRIRRDDYSATVSTVVITAEDMRALGVITVADIIEQLPQGVAQESTAPGEDGASSAEAQEDTSGAVEDDSDPSE